MKKIELIAGAGNIEKAETAFAFGADTIYLGIPEFSLRVRINSFDKKDIKEVVELAHKQKKKVYVTVNIFAHNKHVDKLPTYIKFLKEIKIDGLIVADPGVIAIIKKNWKDAKIHLSTQANCTNWQSAKFWQEQGVKRVVLGREVTLKEIKEIHKKCPKLELEYFVHGAMCMAYSGRCFLSKYFVDRSANLGDCVQPCRWNFKINSPSSQGGVRGGSMFISEEKRPNMPLELVEDKNGSYILNSKDLCLIKHLDKLADAGVTSFKIEGRAKSVYYQATVVHAYRFAIDQLRITNYELRKKEIDKLYKELETRVVNRGYTTGFLLGEKADQNLKEHHTNPSWEFCGVVTKQFQIPNSKFQIKVTVHNTLKVGDILEIVRPADASLWRGKPGMTILKMTLKKIINAKNNQEIDEAHGGGGDNLVIIESEQEIPERSVLRRKLK